MINIVSCLPDASRLAPLWHSRRADREREVENASVWSDVRCLVRAYGGQPGFGGEGQCASGRQTEQGTPNGVAAGPSLCNPFLNIVGSDIEGTKSGHFSSEVVGPVF
jgi:hypothetical protein